MTSFWFPLLSFLLPSPQALTSVCPRSLPISDHLVTHEHWQACSVPTCPAVPVCTGNPTQPTNGAFACPSPAAVGYVCKANCSQGYTGSPSSTCQASGTYSPVTGACSSSGAGSKSYLTVGKAVPLISAPVTRWHGFLALRRAALPEGLKCESLLSSDVLGHLTVAQDRLF